MKDFLEYIVKEMSHHFYTPKHFIRVFGKKRNISRIMTALKIVGEAVSVASTASFLLELLK